MRDIAIFSSLGSCEDVPADFQQLLADIVRAHGDRYRHTHRLAKVQHVALRAIAACRTALLGGRRETCDHCGAERITDNSCRNRHCPACQSRASARWLEARQAELLPIPYFHVVFTLPHTLNPLAQGNPRTLLAESNDSKIHAFLTRGGREGDDASAGALAARTTGAGT